MTLLYNERRGRIGRPESGDCLRGDKRVVRGLPEMPARPQLNRIGCLYSTVSDMCRCLPAAGLLYH